MFRGLYRGLNFRVAGSSFGGQSSRPSVQDGQVRGFQSFEFALLGFRGWAVRPRPAHLYERL